MVSEIPFKAFSIHGKFKGQAYNLGFVFSEFEVVCKVITETMETIMKKGTTPPIFSLIFVISLNAFIICKYSPSSLLKELVMLFVFTVHS